jgi:hypothetical protein
LFLRYVSDAVLQYRESYPSHDHTVRATNIEGKNRHTKTGSKKNQIKKERKRERGVAALWRQLYGGRKVTMQRETRVGCVL